MASNIRELGNLVRIRTGKLDANANDPAGAFPFFTCAREPLSISSYSYDCECVLVAGNGDLNVKYYQGKFDAYQRTYIIESVDKTLLDVRYLYHFMDLYLEQLRHLSIGGVIKYIKLGNLTEAKIPLPSLLEQRRIVAILDQADVLRTKRREALAQLDELQQAIYIEMFGDPVTNPKGWKFCRLDSVSEVGSSKRVFVEELVETGIPFYRGTEVGQLGEGLAAEPSLFISPEHFERLKAETGVPTKGDLLLPSICPDGRIFLVQDDKPFYFKDGRVLWIRVKKSDVDSIFLRQHLKQLFIGNYSKIASGTTFAELKIFALKELGRVLN